MFIQDFLPQTSTASPRTSPMGEEFIDRFRDLLIHMKVHKAIRHQVENHPFGKRIPLDPSEALQDLSKFDFSRVRVKLVMSVPGKYTGFDQMNEYGLCRLGNLLKEEKWIAPAGQRVEGEYQVSSSYGAARQGLTFVGVFARQLHARMDRYLPPFHERQRGSRSGRPTESQRMATYESVVSQSGHGREERA